MNWSGCSKNFWRIIEYTNVFDYCVLRIRYSNSINKENNYLMVANVENLQ